MRYVYTERDSRAMSSEFIAILPSSSSLRISHLLDAILLMKMRRNRCLKQVQLTSEATSCPLGKGGLSKFPLCLKNVCLDPETLPDIYITIFRC